MRRRPPRSTRTDTLFPYTTLFRSSETDSAVCITVPRSNTSAMAPPLHLLRLAIFDSGDNKERLLCLSRGSARWSPAFRNEPGNSVREGMLTQRLFDDAGKSFPCRQFDQTG